MVIIVSDSETEDADTTVDGPNSSYKKLEKLFMVPLQKKIKQ